MKKTLIIGASPNPLRYSYKAAHMLQRFKHDIVNIGVKKGEVAGVEIKEPSQIHTDIDTITLYIGPQNQPEYYDYILQTKPKRIIFNPGAENHELELLAKENGIDTIEACTLVMLSTGQY